MEQDLKDKLYDEYNEFLASISNKDISLQELGFTTENSCAPMLFGILIHCFQNLEIFDAERQNNIMGYINKLRYVG